MTVLLNDFVCAYNDMITRRMSTRVLEEGRMNKEIPPHVDQVHKKSQGVQVPIGGEHNEVPVVPSDMINWEIIEILLALALSITTHVNRGVEPIVNAMESIMTSSLRDFVGINSPISHGSKKGQDLQDFLDGVYMVLSAIRRNSRDKVDLASYQLR